jgi:hypothetical protein
MTYDVTYHLMLPGQIIQADTWPAAEVIEEVDTWEEKNYGLKKLSKVFVQKVRKAFISETLREMAC